MDKVQRKGDFKVSGTRGRVKCRLQGQALPQIPVSQRKQLWLPRFCWDFLWTGSELGFVLFPARPKGVNGLARGFQKSNERG